MEDPTNWLKPTERIRHRRQRAANGFSTFDWWNFSSYLTWVITQGLERFKDGAGYPGDLSGMDEWRALLDEMIEGFLAKEELSEMETFKPGEQDFATWAAPLQAKWERGGTLFVERFGSLWD